jgi:soluble lytic murein transglycosylase-like protein
MSTSRLKQLGPAVWRWLRSPFSPVPICLVLLGIGLFSWLAGEGAPASPVRPPERENRYDRLLRAAADRYMPPGWDWHILKAMVRQESNFHPDANSRVGARGLCQMMPATAKAMGVAPGELDDPAVSIRAGAKCLRRLWDRWIGTPDRPPKWTRSRFAVASYNAGITRVRRTARRKGARTWEALRRHLPTETQIHVHKVFDLFYPAYAEPAPRRKRPARPSFSSNQR